MSMKELLTYPSFRDFLDFVKEEKDSLLIQLLEEKDANRMFRLQGQIAAMTWVLEQPEMMMDTEDE